MEKAKKPNCQNVFVTYFVLAFRAVVAVSGYGCLTRADVIADSSSKPEAILERFDRKTCDCEAQVGHGVQRYRFCSLHMSPLQVNPITVGCHDHYHCGERHTMKAHYWFFSSEDRNVLRVMR